MLPSTAGQLLLRKINGEKLWAGVDVFVTGHHLLLNTVSLLGLDLWIGSRQDGHMKRAFLRPR